MSWIHLEDATPVSRKPRRCWLCGRAIPPGERHTRRVGVGEDGISAIRMHDDCKALTAGWDEDQWMYHDPGEFRECELREVR